MVTSILIIPSLHCANTSSDCALAKVIEAPSGSMLVSVGTVVKPEICPIVGSNRELTCIGVTSTSNAAMP
eukprot:2853324-Ditylum_brightwellii.AAC.1